MTKGNDKEKAPACDRSFLPKLVEAAGQLFTLLSEQLDYSFIPVAGKRGVLIRYSGS